MTLPTNSPGTEKEPGASGPDDRFRTERHGMDFQVIVEPDEVAWIEVRRGDGELVDLQRVSGGMVDIGQFADGWVEDRLVSVTPLSRCKECGLAVEVLAEDRRPSRRGNLAVEFDLCAQVDAVEAVHFDKIVLCMRCRSQLLRRYKWLRHLLGTPTDPRRAR